MLSAGVFSLAVSLRLDNATAEINLQKAREATANIERLGILDEKVP